MGSSQQSEAVIEIVSDAGEGAQKAGTAFALCSARMGNSLWTVEIIPAEIQPPPHTIASASGIRIRLGSGPVTNGGDRAELALVFNEQALLSRVQGDFLRDDAVILIDDIWAEDPVLSVREGYERVLAERAERGARIYRLPIEKEAGKILEDPRKGKNMWALGVLAWIYDRDLEILKTILDETFAKASDTVRANNRRLLEAGHAYAAEHLDLRVTIPAIRFETPMIAMNGNTALALGAIAAGFEICSMYPITPATSVSHTLSDVFERLGGFVHQAEDEIAAVGVAIGANYAGRPALTVTSGPGLALKTEFLGLAVMTETPLVLIDVQRGGPSTGLPTKVEQSDLLAALFATPGDAPRVVIAPGTIEECFHVCYTARKIAEDLRTTVIVLSDANLATGVQLFERPEVSPADPPPCDRLEPVPPGTLPFDWNEATGIAPRVIPGTPGGASMTSGLNHGPDGMVKQDGASNMRTHRMRSRKIAAFQKTLLPPQVYGGPTGELLLVGWGSTLGAIQEAVDACRAEGLAVSALHLHFLSPLPPGLDRIFADFGDIMTVEINYSDPPPEQDSLFDADNRRYGQLAQLLRARYLRDIDSFSFVPGRPLMPREIADAIHARLSRKESPQKPSQKRSRKSSGGGKHATAADR